VESFRDESLVPTGSISSGRVNKIDPELECALQNLFTVVPSLIRPKVPGLAGQTHRAIAEAAHLRAIVESKCERGLHRGIFTPERRCCVVYLCLLSGRELTKASRNLVAQAGTIDKYESLDPIK
jgi:hypothetical protein